MFNLPDSAKVNTIAAKAKFTSKPGLSSAIRKDFNDTVQRIIWLYKIAESTLGITRTPAITEIQIFSVELKRKVIPHKVLQLIQSSVAYPVLFTVSHGEERFHLIYSHEGTPYFSEWNDPVNFNFYALNLDLLYQNLIRAFMPPQIQEISDFSKAVELDARIKSLQKEIARLEARIKSETQFNRKVELNITLQKTKSQFTNLMESL